MYRESMHVHSALKMGTPLILAICLLTYNKISNAVQVKFYFKIPYVNHQWQSDPVQGKPYVGLHHFQPSQSLCSSSQQGSTQS